MKNVYVKTRLNKGIGKVVRSIGFTRGGIHVVLDFDKNRHLTGVEILEAKEVKINGKKV